MRSARWIALGVLSLALRPAAASESPAAPDGALYTATVVQPEAEVRSGPGTSAQLYATNRLRKGDRVEVVRELPDGWLAVKPPPGSFSWISTRFLQRLSDKQPMWVVVGDPAIRVPLLMGSDIRPDKPTVEGAKVRPGTQFKSIGPMRLADDGYWLPVEPPPSEVRYVRAEAVSRNGAGENPALTGAPKTDVSPLPPSPGVGATAPPSPLTPAPAPPGGDARWAQAQQMEQAGRFADAAQLYRQMATELLNSNHGLAMQAYNRAQWIEKNRLVPTPQPGTVVQPIAATVSRPSTTTPSPTPGPTAAPPANPAMLPPGWVNSGPGWLREANSYIDTQQVYVLENSQGIPIAQAVAQSPYTLQPYVGKMVELHGVRRYRPDLRNDLLTVMRIQLLQ